MIKNPETAISCEITIDAPASKVFPALIEPAQLSQWFADDDFRADRWECDVRPNGRWSTTGNLPGGRSFTVSGTYLIIDPPRALELTWNEGGDESTLVRFDLTESAGKTLVRVTHYGFTDPEDREQHLSGWKNILASLAAYAAV